MQFRKCIIISAVLVAVAFAFTAFAADNDPVTVAGILKAANCPLTAEQQAQIDAYQVPQMGQGGAGGGMAGGGAGGVRGGGMMGGLTGMFDEKQTAALIAVLGETPAFNNRPASPRNLTQVIILEKAGVPLTEKQVNDLKNAMAAAQGGQGGTDIQSIYTQAQIDALGPMAGRGMRGGGMGGGGMGGN